MPKRWHTCGSRGPWGLKQDPGDQQESRPQSKGMLRPGQNLGPSTASGPGIHAGSPAPGCTHRQAGTGEEGSRADHLQIWGWGWLLQPGGRQCWSGRILARGGCGLTLQRGNHEWCRMDCTAADSFQRGTPTTISTLSIPQTQNPIK